MSDRSRLAKNLEYLREESGWTKTYVSKKLGLSNMATYANWEYGTREPDAKALLDLASIYGVSVDFLLGRNDKTTKDPRTKQETIAAHIDDDATEEEMEDILNYIEFIKQKHRKG